MSAAPIRITLAQINLRVGDIEGNMQRMMAAAEHARSVERADCVVFPELSITSYPPEDLLLRPGFVARAVEAVSQLAAAVPDIDVVVGHPQPDGARLYNACSVLRGGRVVQTYRKQHLPNYGVFDEKRYFSPGTSAAVFDLKGLPCALTICEDLWVPGTGAQARAAGARLMLNINGSPWHMDKVSERAVVVGRTAVEGRMPVLYVNLVGGQDELVFDGASMAVDEEGRCVARGPEFQEAFLTIEVDTDPLKVREQVSPPLLATEAAVYSALVLGVRDYVDKNGFPGAVLGLSGGVDSALTLAIAADALGAERVDGILMPSRYTVTMSIEDAELEARNLGVAHHVIPIEGPYTAFLECLAPLFAGLPEDTTEENIQARCRGVILMAISNKTGRIVLTTGNKSEVAVGYATLYGDMAGGFAPLKDVPKTLVYRLARWRNAQSPVIPERVLERAPTAELRAGQTDQDSLPPYDVLDAILERYVELNQTPQQIAQAGFDPVTVRAVARMVDRNEYKRRQAAPGVRITRRAFGRDRRYPITSGYRED